MTTKRFSVQDMQVAQGRVYMLGYYHNLLVSALRSADGHEGYDGYDGYHSVQHLVEKLDKEIEELESFLQEVSCTVDIARAQAIDINDIVQQINLRMFSVEAPKGYLVQGGPDEHYA